MHYPDWVLERSFGGLGVAVSPLNGTRAGRWPDGKSSPMSMEACQALIMACTAGSGDGPSQLVFLVGGAGNGKSKLAAEVVNTIDGTQRGTASDFAQRCYDFDLPNKRALRVVNDATIPPKDKHRHALRRDISNALRNRDHFLGCINRGVLIAEVGSGDEALDDVERVAAMLVSWLLYDKAPGGDHGDVRLELGSDESGGSHYRFGTVSRAGEVDAVIHVVFMDRASLLEVWPETEDPKRPDVALACPEIMVTPLLTFKRSTTPSAFEACLSNFSKSYLDEIPENEMDPVRANALSLSREQAARGWCSLMRGVEILSGSHFTYRELWALSVHSLLGPVGSDTHSELASHVDRMISKATPSALSVKDGTEKLEALLALGSLRTHMLLFDAGRRPVEPEDKEAFPWPRTTSEALQAVHYADPLRQFGENTGEEAARLNETLDGLKNGRRPGADLAEKDMNVKAYWTRLDAEIEDAIGRAIDPGAPFPLFLKDRSRLLAWYGRYMHRLVALARGWPAFVSVAAEWQQAWLEAHLRQRLDVGIENAILEILAPTGEQGRSAYFTFLQPKVTAGESHAPKIRIEMPRNQIALAARTTGGRVDIEISLRSQHEDGPAAVATLDFHLMREAMSRCKGHGFTDSLLLVEPRIERLRAAMVATQLKAEGDRNRYQFSNRNFAITR